MALAALCLFLAREQPADIKPKEMPAARTEAPEDDDLPLRSDAGPEAQLERIFAEIGAFRLDRALQHTESLIQQYPNFRLAYLIKGDLLLARARPLDTFGAAQNAPPAQVADLRAEAIARLQGYRHKPPEDQAPRYLLQLRADQRHAIVVDVGKSRLYLYRNDAGFPRLVTDYYVTQGKLGAQKMAEGDKRTPIGVYHVTAYLPREKLADMYGNGAFPINYPNEWDKREGRGGSGIWLHGTPSDTFSRPPRASDGCVVLANPDFDRLGQEIQVGLTPVIISDAVEWRARDTWQAEGEEIRRAIEAWRADWESRDVERYLAHYSGNFRGNGQDHAAYAAQKRRVNRGKTWIKVKLDNLSIFRNPGKEDVVVVTFDQAYESNNLANTMRKRQYWQKEEGAWKIVYEGAGT
ncbi:MAG: L,D-transpeptidase family protein [Zoogloeaceae bacterium]|nr:L,D-transpeptidase family protein [Zoogloeaceae bacterium]